MRLSARLPIEGRIVSVSTTAVRFANGDSLDTTLIRQVDIARTRRSGAIPGALLGTVLLGTPIYYFLLDSESDIIQVGGIAAGGVLGAVIGSAIRPGRTPWQTVWPPPDR